MLTQMTQINEYDYQNQKYYLEGVSNKFQDTIFENKKIL